MDPETPIRALESVFRDPSWPAVALLLRWGFLLLMARIALGLLGSRVPRLSGKNSRPAGWLAGWRWMLVAGVLLILGRQAGWQLLGRRQPEFLAFMQRYDLREFNPAHRIRAGRLQDRTGQDLAVSALTDDGVRRVYRYGPIFSHVLGYNHPVYGMTGLESAARRELLGPGLSSPGGLQELGAEILDREAHTEGPSLRTTLDLGLQRKAAELLGDRRGAVVVLDVRTGGVRCLVSHPAFDPNRLRREQFQRGDPAAPFLNRALQGLYPPGSVFKLLVAAAALDQGFRGTLDTPPEGFTTSASTPPIRDHDYYAAKERGQVWRGHGRIDLGTALAESSNVFFAQLGVRVGAENLLAACRSAGLDQPLDLGPTAEPTLNVKPAAVPELSDSLPYATAQFSIGQGELLVTPMHMALLVAGVARSGEVPRPVLTGEAPARPLGRLCSPESAETLKWMMYKVVQEGTGRRIRMADLPVAGKTGTAETGGGRPSHSWFAGFAPVSEPRWAFCVMVEHGGYGSTAALPIARDLLRFGKDSGRMDR